MPKPYTPNDKWSQKAAQEGYRARSVYKLKELDERFKLLKPGMTVLDFGAAPGSWLQYTSEKVGPNGKLIGIDLKEIESIDGAKTVVCDITDINKINNILINLCIHKVDLILSDLAPNTSGIRDVDQYRSIELSESVIKVASVFLKTPGKCVLKVLRGADFDNFIRNLKKYWQTVKIVKTKASRDRSNEVYVVLKK